MSFNYQYNKYKELYNKIDNLCTKIIVDNCCSMYRIIEGDLSKNENIINEINNYSDLHLLVNQNICHLETKYYDGTNNFIKHSIDEIKKLDIICHDKCIFIWIKCYCSHIIDALDTFDISFNNDSNNMDVDIKIFQKKLFDHVKLLTGLNTNVKLLLKQSIQCNDIKCMK